MAAEAPPLPEPGALLVKQGAEARVYWVDFFGRAAALKERFAKQYRHPDLDRKLTQRRVAGEVKNMIRCRKAGIDTPAVLQVDKERGRIYMERVDAVTARDFLARHDLEQLDSNEQVKTVADAIGAAVGAMHNADVMHGDLTTSNLLLRPSLHLVVIDFGLSFQSRLLEDRAVDLYVLERALLSTHPHSAKLFARILQSYAAHCALGAKVLRRLDDVRARGRKRDMVG